MTLAMSKSDLDAFDRSSTDHHTKLMEERPPVIGQEQIESNADQLPTTSATTVMSTFVHPPMETAKPPPVLPPKPRICSTPLSTTQRGPPPPVLPRSSSLTFHNNNNNSDSLSVVSSHDESERINNNLFTISETGQNPSEAVILTPLLKCDNLSEETPQPPPPGKPAFESGRGFEPEGSVDMSPSYSESGSGATNNGTPPYVRWTEGFSFLLEDRDGTSLFQKYLEEQKLAHYLDFLIICRGFKKNDEADVEALIKAVYKRYINPRNRKGHPRIECLDDETRTLIEAKLSSRDKNIFDGAVESVTLHLASKFYPNFLTSEIFVEYVGSFQQNEVDSRVSAASSVSGRHLSELQDGSGLDEDKGFFSSSAKSSTVPLMSADTTASVGFMPSSLPSTTTSSMLNSNAYLPTVDEDRELKLDAGPLVTPLKTGPPPATTPYANPPPTEPHMSRHSSASRTTTTTSSSTGPPPGRSSRWRPNEVHPSALESGVSPALDIRSASYAYHANSSNWNPVSRQDSELQSQSSGAVGGDTTDDYSTFSDVQQQKLKLAKQVAAAMTASAVAAAADSRAADIRKADRRQQQKLLQRNEKVSLGREDPKMMMLHKQNLDRQASSGTHKTPDASTEFEAFAKLVISKLEIVVRDQEGTAKLNQKLSAINDGDSSVASYGPYKPHEQQQQQKRFTQLAMLGSRSQGDPFDAESDQSILDDHVSRIFPAGGTDTPPAFGRSHRRKPNVSANTTSAFDMSHRSINMSNISGTSTLPGRSKSAAGYPPYGPHMSTSMIQPSTSSYHPPSYRPANLYHQSGMTSEIPAARSGTSKSLVDMSGTTAPQPTQQHVPLPPYAGQQKVTSWLKNVPSSGTGPQSQYSSINAANSSLNPGHAADHLTKTSPRSSGRYQHHQPTSGSSRARSQDRSGTYSGMYNMSQSFSMGQQYSSGGLDPTYLASRLQEQQQQIAGPGVASSSSRLMTSSTSMLGGMMAPGGASSSDVKTTVVYRFPQEKDEMPYRVKISRACPTLIDIKMAMPKKDNNFRFYFKTKVDGEACFEQETNDSAVVPMWEGSIVVQCRND